jgi:hypothetical protein
MTRAHERLRLKFSVGNFPFTVEDGGFLRVFSRAVGKGNGKVHVRMLESKHCFARMQIAPRFLFRHSMNNIILA